MGDLYGWPFACSCPLAPIICIAAMEAAETVYDASASFTEILNRCGEGFEHESLAFDRIVDGCTGP
jgi:hypothetical protein